MTLFFLKMISRGLNLVPPVVSRGLGNVLGAIWYWVIPIRRDVVIENLTSVFGEKLPAAKIQRLARENYRHYGQVLVEICRSLTWNAEQYRQNVTVTGLEHVEKCLAEGKGGFFLTCHLGNWELLVGSGAASGIPVDIVVKRSKTPAVEKLLKWYRNRLDVGVLIEEGTAKDILRSLSNNRFVGFIFDQFMGPPIGLPVKFFGRLAGTPVALALITEKRDVPVLPAYSYRDATGRLHTVIEAPLQYPELSQDKNERLFQKTQIFNNVLEEKIRMHPEQWLWLHRRWKEYRGTHRWPIAQAVSFALLFLVLACSSGPTKVSTPTGIEIPKDPTIEVPKFIGEQDSFDAIQKFQEAPAKKPEVAVVKEPAPKKTKKKEKEPERKAAQVIPPSEFTSLPSYKIPFEMGERLELALGWTALPAGTAVLEVRKGETFNNRPTFLLWGNVLSSRIVDAVYHVDNTIESYVDTQGFIPYKFLLHMVESKQLKETRVSFDHTKGKAFYWAQRKSQQWGDALDDRADDLVPQAKDLFSGIYFARTLTYKLNEKQTVRVYENGKNWEVELVPVANELVTTKAGAFQCWKILVTVKLDNVLRPTGDIFMWLSDDSKKYLVKFDAKIKIGSLYGTLVSLREKQ